MAIEKVLWLEDQHDDFDAYKSALFRAGYVVHNVPSVSEVIEELRGNKDDYVAVIFDIKVLPGKDPAWIKLDEDKRAAKPYFGAYLGFELMRSLFNADKAAVKIDPPIELDPKKVIVFSVVFDKTDEIAAFGIPGNQILDKATSALETLPRLIKEIQLNSA
ncbi:MAG: response regulator transcription factor, partial [bacterium]|nr:response regulator transcription factor [bacterium]